MVAMFDGFEWHQRTLDVKLDTKVGVEYIPKPLRKKEEYADNSRSVGRGGYRSLNMERSYNQNAFTKGGSVNQNADRNSFESRSKSRDRSERNDNPPYNYSLAQNFNKNEKGGYSRIGFGDFGGYSGGYSSFSVSGPLGVGGGYGPTGYGSGYNAGGYDGRPSTFENGTGYGGGGYFNPLAVGGYEMGRGYDGGDYKRLRGEGYYSKDNIMKDNIMGTGYSPSINKSLGYGNPSLDKHANKYSNNNFKHSERHSERGRLSPSSVEERWKKVDKKHKSEDFKEIRNRSPISKNNHYRGNNTVLLATRKRRTADDD
ncbi:hypothetical protein HK099_008682 [Clydaea vesicula]|uniref:Uncharacterized protein n=1 Tax=Clydaea vesicula TaxID=447962 RepID=A0AAD5XXT4_9FUNG|nr:hypothetical protein HK099_008682 [Clydaea vesicula]